MSDKDDKTNAQSTGSQNTGTQNTEKTNGKEAASGIDSLIGSRSEPFIRQVGNFVTNLAQGFSKTFLTPSILTVIITAIAGPIVVNQINNDIKNKEIQQEVIKTVLEYTSQADFSKPESIEKIAIIAKMVDENQGVFGLSFTKTDSTIQGLYGQISKVGLNNLDKKRQEYKQNIRELQAKLSQDSARLATLNTEMAKLEEQRQRYEERRQSNRLEEISRQIAEKEIEIKKVQSQMSFYRDRISDWREQLAALEEDIEEAQDDLANLLEEKMNRQEELSEAFNKSQYNADSLRNLLDSYIKQINDLKGRLQQNVSWRDTAIIYRDSVQVLQQRLQDYDED